MAEQAKRDREEHEVRQRRQKMEQRLRDRTSEIVQKNKKSIEEWNSKEETRRQGLFDKLETR